MALPVKRQAINRCVCHQAVALVKVGLQPGQLAAPFGGFKPQRQLGNFNTFSVDIDAKQVVLQYLVADVGIQQFRRR